MAYRISRKSKKLYKVKKGAKKSARKTYRTKAEARRALRKHA